MVAKKKKPEHDGRVEALKKIDLFPLEKSIGQLTFPIEPDEKPLSHFTVDKKIAFLPLKKKVTILQILRKMNTLTAKQRDILHTYEKTIVHSVYKHYMATVKGRIPLNLKEKQWFW